MVRHEDQPESAQGISPDMSVGQAMRMAMEFERTAQAFYQRLAERVHPEARALVLALADEEQKHLALLRDLSLDQDLAKVLAQRHAIPPTQPRFDSFVALCDLPEGSTEDEILTYVESRERIAFEHYGYLAELAPPGPLQNLFAFLREEERGTKPISKRAGRRLSVSSDAQHSAKGVDPIRLRRRRQVRRFCPI